MQGPEAEDGKGRIIEIPFNAMHPPPSLLKKASKRVFRPFCSSLFILKKK
jgi:hypothetical protein